MKFWTVVLATICCFVHGDSEPEYYFEELNETWTQGFKMDKLYFEGETSFQDVIVFENEQFGKVLALDGIVQLTEKDEFVYHEMITHPALLMHPNPKNVLVIGGGDGGTIREVLKHPALESVTMVELDPKVVEISKKYLPEVSRGAFDNPKLTLIHEDGFEYLAKHLDEFDLIIVDSCDPVGAAEILFSSEFFALCKGALKEGGYLVTQNGTTFNQLQDEVPVCHQRRLEHFDWATYYLAPVPCYAGGFMAFGITGKTEGIKQPSQEELAKRIEEMDSGLKYYNAEIHHASFALPNYVKEMLAKS